MRIIGKECLKILDLRRISVIVIFTVMYYLLFIHLDTYPHIPTLGGMTETSYVPELVRDVGPSLSRDQWYLLEEKRRTLLAEINEILSSHPALAEAGIDTYDKWKEAYHALFLASETSTLATHVMSLYTQEGPAQRCLSLLSYIDDLNEIYEMGFLFSVPPSEAASIAEEHWSYASPLYKKVIPLFCQRDLSMLPLTISTLLWTDMRHMIILLIICSLILLVPCQIQERLCEVIPLYATTHTGRRIFTKQFAAQLLSCGIVTLVQLLIYVGIYISKGLAVYWNCPAWPAEFNTFWLDITFGTYMAIYLSMMWLFVMGNTVLAYCIGRCSGNYIVGIAISIPIGGIVCFLGRKLLFAPFAFTEYVRVPLWEPLGLLLWLALTGLLLMTVLKRDRIRNL